MNPKNPECLHAYEYYYLEGVLHQFCSSCNLVLRRWDEDAPRPLNDVFLKLTPMQRKVLVATAEGRAVWRNYQTKILNHLNGLPSSVVPQGCIDSLSLKRLIKISGHVWEVTQVGRDALVGRV